MFDKIKGHREVLSKFEKNLNQQDFEGVYLFTGPNSVGKLTVARQLARYLLCTGLVDDTCRCETCRLFPNVPDYLEISKGDENILVSDVNSLLEFVSLVPYRSRFRVVIIDNAHNLNPTATNSLLKTLEDLKDNCIVILVTSQPDKLFPTIVSRCYEIEFNALKTDEIVEILKAKGHDPTKLTDYQKMMPYLTDNVLVNYEKYVEYSKYVTQFVKDLPSMKEDDLVSAVKEIDGKQELQFFIEVLIIFLNDIMKMRYGSPDTVLNLKKLDYIEELTASWKEDICVFLLDKLRGVQVNMGKNINLKHGQFVTPVFGWLFYFVHKQKAADESQ